MPPLFWLHHPGVFPASSSVMVDGSAPETPGPPCENMYLAPYRPPTGGGFCALANKFCATTYLRFPGHRLEWRLSRSMTDGWRVAGGGWLGQSGELCEPRAPAKVMVKAGARRSFLTPLPQPPAERHSRARGNPGPRFSSNKRHSNKRHRTPSLLWLRHPDVFAASPPVMVGGSARETSGPPYVLPFLRVLASLRETMTRTGKTPVAHEPGTGPPGDELSLSHHNLPPAGCRPVGPLLPRPDRTARNQVDRTIGPPRSFLATLPAGG